MMAFAKKKSTSIHLFSPIVGMSHHDGAQAALDALPDGAMMLLRREPKNEHDANAVGVWYKRQRIGYLPRDRAAEIAPMIDERIGRGVMDNPMMMARLDRSEAVPRIDAKFKRRGTADASDGDTP